MPELEKLVERWLEQAQQNENDAKRWQLNGEVRRADYAFQRAGTYKACAKQLQEALKANSGTPG